jgi:hypothetical protein
MVRVGEAQQDHVGQVDQLLSRPFVATALASLTALAEAYPIQAPKSGATTRRRG